MGADLIEHSIKDLISLKNAPFTSETLLIGINDPGKVMERVITPTTDIL